MFCQIYLESGFQRLCTGQAVWSHFMLGFLYGGVVFLTCFSSFLERQLFFFQTICSVLWTITWIHSKFELLLHPSKLHLWTKSKCNCLKFAQYAHGCLIETMLVLSENVFELFPVSVLFQVGNGLFSSQYIRNVCAALQKYHINVMECSKCLPNYLPRIMIH